MKKLLIFALLILPFALQAQTGVINTIAGNGVIGSHGDGGSATAASFHFIADVAVRNGSVYIADMYNNRVRKVTDGVVTIVAGADTLGGATGDGGPATAANLYGPTGLAFDLAGNLYIACNNGIRKINTSGIISTVAGTGTSGYSGDGGPATAAQLSGTWAVALDAAGNMYIADQGNNRIRKVNASGIITTIAGTYSSSSTGDGGPATAAEIGTPCGVAIDGAGNVYISDNMNDNVRKITADGVIHTFAGGGSTTFVDGIAATSAQLFQPSKVSVDGMGNVYIANGGLFRIWKVDPSGIARCAAGNGTGGYSGDGGMATAAMLSWPSGVFPDDMGNIYIGEQVNNRVRKVNSTPTISADSFSVFIGNNCESVEFYMVSGVFSAGQHIKTSFGNGTSLDTITTLGISGGHASIFTQYGASGTYTIKHVLYDGAVAVDSISYPYEFQFCTNMSIKFYNDLNGNCLKDTSEPYSGFPILTEVDSNSIPIDTISASSGFYYIAHGSPGDVYSFKLIDGPAGLYASCPSTGIIYDTVQYFSSTIPTKKLALSCSTSAGFDLVNYVTALTGRHMQMLDILVNNTFCTPEDATLTLNFSPQYTYSSAVPAAASVVGNTATWNISGLSASLLSQPHIHVTLDVPGTWLLPGDTINTASLITPTTGDLVPANNSCIRNDTVKSSFDPNEMSVSPQGFIHAGTQLTYTINFENTGNDTAQNIYVMDTLSDNVDQHSLRFVAASAAMNISQYASGGHNIVKFDFPAIKLLDSSHHNQCDGLVIFNINAKAGLVDGTTIYNHAGIFFDDNPVVMTDTVVNVIGFPVGIAKNAINNQTEIYPNPATNQLTIKTDIGTYSSVTITNIVGQPVMQQALTTTETTVNVAPLPSGVYFVTLKGSSGDVVKKFVKM